MLEDATTTNLDGRDTVYLEFTDVKGLNEQGEVVEIGLNSVQPLIIYNLEVTESVDVVEQETRHLKIYPNPTDRIVTLQSGNQENMELEVVDVNGRLIGNYFLVRGRSNIDVSRWKNGLYFVKWTENGKTVVEKFVK